MYDVISLEMHPYINRVPLEVQERMEEARQYVNSEVARRYPQHFNLVHARHRGIFYHFYRNSSSTLPRPNHETVDLACRKLHDELEDLFEDQSIPSVDIRCQDGSLAARIQIVNRAIPLENNFQTAVRIYKNWLYYNERHPQFANVTIILE